MSRMRTTKTIRWTTALAAVLALGLSACGEDAEADMEAAGQDMQAAAEDAGEAMQDMAEDAGEAIEDAGEELDGAMEDMQDDAASMRTPSPDGAEIMFANLEDGATVTSPFMVEFAVEGMEVAPAGDQTPDTGHFHILIDTTADDLDLDMPIPADEQHVHFGAGQMETELELPAGEHTLQLLMGDWTHIPHDPVVASDVITVTVE